MLYFLTLRSFNIKLHFLNTLQIDYSFSKTCFERKTNAVKFSSEL
jgi:hypothetical protein